MAGEPFDITSGVSQDAFWSAFNQQISGFLNQQKAVADREFQLRQGIFRSLLQSKDPRVVALAIAGIKEPKHLKGLLELGKSPALDQLEGIVSNIMPQGDQQKSAATPPVAPNTSTSAPPSADTGASAASLLPPPSPEAPAAMPEGALNTPAQMPASAPGPAAASGAGVSLPPPTPGGPDATDITDEDLQFERNLQAQQSAAAPTATAPTAPPNAQGTTVQMPGGGTVSTPFTDYNSMIAKWQAHLDEMKAELRSGQTGGPLGIGPNVQTGVSQADISKQEQAIQVLKSYADAGKPFQDGFEAAMNTLSPGVQTITKTESAEKIAADRLAAQKEALSQRMDYLDRSLKQRKEISDASLGKSVFRAQLNDRLITNRQALDKLTGIRTKAIVDKKNLDAGGSALEDLQGRLQDFITARTAVTKDSSPENLRKVKSAFDILQSKASAYSRLMAREFGENRVTDRDATAFEDFLKAGGTWDAIDPTFSVERLNSAVNSHNAFMNTILGDWQTLFDATAQMYGHPGGQTFPTGGAPTGTPPPANTPPPTARPADVQAILNKKQSGGTLTPADITRLQQYKLTGR